MFDYRWRNGVLEYYPKDFTRPQPISPQRAKAVLLEAYGNECRRHRDAVTLFHQLMHSVEESGPWLPICYSADDIIRLELATGQLLNDALLLADFGQGEAWLKAVGDDCTTWDYNGAKVTVDQGAASILIQSEVGNG